MMNQNRIYELNTKTIGELVTKVIENPTYQTGDDLIVFLYEETTDSGHGVKHLRDVLTSAYAFRDGVLNADEILAVVFHDIATEGGRKGHEDRGVEFFRDVVLPEIDASKVDASLIECAIREHRGSFKGELSSSLSELVSSADRGCPKGLDNIVKRSYKYAIDYQNANHEEAMQHAIDHINDKYSREGYGKFPPLYINYYKNEIEKFYDDIDNLTIEKVASMVGGK